MHNALRIQQIYNMVYTDIHAYIHTHMHACTYIHNVRYIQQSENMVCVAADALTVLVKLTDIQIEFAKSDGLKVAFFFLGFAIVYA